MGQALHRVFYIQLHKMSNVVPVVGAGSSEKIKTFRDSIICQRLRASK